MCNTLLDYLLKSFIADKKNEFFKRQQVEVKI